MICVWATTSTWFYLHLQASVPQPSTPRWNMHQADWGAFRLLCQAKLRYDPHDITTNSLENFSATLLSIATETIPKTSKQQHRQSVPWFNDSCKSAVADRKCSLQASNKNPTNMNRSNLRVFRAKAPRTHWAKQTRLLEIRNVRNEFLNFGSVSVSVWKTAGSVRFRLRFGFVKNRGSVRF